MKSEIFFVYGICNLGDIPIAWEVAAFNDEPTAQEYAQLCMNAAIEKFNNELSSGFEIGDSISVQNRCDVNAQYARYFWVEEENRYHVDVVYRYRKVPLIHNILQYNLKVGVNLQPSIKYDENVTIPYEEYSMLGTDEE